MQCPIDQETLMMAERQGIEIDYCPKCRGVWLDRGELDKLIEGGGQSHEVQQASPPQRDTRPGYQEPYYKKKDDDYYYKKKKKDSFLKDLFDF